MGLLCLPIFAKMGKMELLKLGCNDRSHSSKSQGNHFFYDRIHLNRTGVIKENIKWRSRNLT